MIGVRGGNNTPAANARASNNNDVVPITGFFKPVDRNSPEYQAEQQKRVEREAAELAARRAQNQERENQKQLEECLAITGPDTFFFRQCSVETAPARTGHKKHCFIARPTKNRARTRDKTFFFRRI